MAYITSKTAEEAILTEKAYENKNGRKRRFTIQKCRLGKGKLYNKQSTWS
jgi:hypothetical protein